MFSLYPRQSFAKSWNTGPENSWKYPPSPDCQCCSVRGSVVVPKYAHGTRGKINIDCWGQGGSPKNPAACDENVPKTFAKDCLGKMV